MSAFPEAWVADIDNPTGPLVIRVRILREYATGIHYVRPLTGYGRHGIEMIAETFDTWEEARQSLIRRADSRLASAQDHVDACIKALNSCVFLQKPEGA
jgi:hypothetical protein